MECDVREGSPDTLKPVHFRIFAALSVFGGLAALFFTFSEKSEAQNARLGGYSLSRWGLGLGTIVLTLVFLLILLRELRTDGALTKKLSGCLCQGDRAWFCLLVSLLCLYFSLWAFKFSWLFIPKNLRPQILWAALIFLSAVLILYSAYRERFKTGKLREKYRLFPRLRDLSGKQKKVLLILAVLSLIYIAVLMPSNINGSRDWDDFRHYGGDEYVIYPILQNVLTPGDDFSATLYHHYIHEDYHYGYPFYAVSSLFMYPIRLFIGPDFMQRINLTLPTLRTMVSVVPLMLGCLILVYMTTRFESPWLSPAVYLFLLTAPGSLQNNQGFWHPDGLNLFFVCAALYFMQRDRLRYGRNFFFAAFWIGFSAATRLFGFFFFLAVGVYLLYGLFRKLLDLRRMLGKGLLFILIMAGTILWSDPFLFRSDARQNMIAILTEKTGEMATGYNADFNDPKNDYRPGWDAWYPAFEDHFTEMYCFFFLIASLLASCFLGRERWTYRILALWWVVVSVYLIWFVAVKSTQYVLPMMLPLMSCIFALPRALRESGSRRIRLTALILSGGVFLSQLIINIIKIAPRFR